MYCFAKICCLCLQYNRDLYKLEEMDPHGVMFFEKLIVLIPAFEQLVKKSIPNYICRKCKRYLNKFFKFQQNCLKSYKLLESYLKQLDNTENSMNLEDNQPEQPFIENDLILMKEDMEECLKNMEIYPNEDNHKTTIEPSNPVQTEEPKTLNQVTSPKSDTSSRKRTRQSKKISYNEEYDSDTVISDSELYYTQGAKRKAKQQKISDNPKKDKTLVIPQNDVFAKDLTRTLNDIITRLAANNNVNTSKPEEFKVKFKNSSGNSEQLSIYQDKDTVEVRFTKEEKMGFLRVCQIGESFMLTHNMSDSSGDSPATNKPAEELEVPGTSKQTPAEVVPPEEDSWQCVLCLKTFKTRNSLMEHLNEYLDYKKMCCNICDKTFERTADLKNHIDIHSPAKATSAETEAAASRTKANTPAEPIPLDVAPEIQSNVEAVLPREALSPRSPLCEIKVVLSDIQGTQMKSERSSSPEYQFHLSDDSEDEFDNDTLILGSLDHDNDFSDTRSPSPVELGSEVLEFLKEKDVPKCLDSSDCKQLPQQPPETVIKSSGSSLLAALPRESVQMKSDPKKGDSVTPGDAQKLSPNKGRIVSENGGPSEEISPSLEDVISSSRKDAGVNVGLSRGSEEMREIRDNLSPEGEEKLSSNKEGISSEDVAPLEGVPSIPEDVIPSRRKDADVNGGLSRGSVEMIEARDDLTPGGEEKLSPTKGAIVSENVGPLEGLAPSPEDVQPSSKNKADVNGGLLRGRMRRTQDNLTPEGDQKLSPKKRRIVSENVGPPEDVLPPSRKDTDANVTNDDISNLRSIDCLNKKEADPENPSTNGVHSNNSFEEKHLKIIINKMEVDDYLTKNKTVETKNKAKKRRSSSRKQTEITKTV